MTEDQGIEIKAVSRIGDRFKDSAHVNVTSYNRMVLLTGEVPDAAAKSRRGAHRARPSRTCAASTTSSRSAGHARCPSRTNDSVITSKVKARFVDGAEVQPAARQGRHREQRRLPDGAGEEAGSGRRHRDRAHDERGAEGGRLFEYLD